MSNTTQRAVAIVGAGPSGLFAAETLLSKGFAVALYDRMPSPGRKFLLAGNSGGLNLTSALGKDEFASRYGENRDRFAHFLSGFSPDDLVAWLSSFGVSTRRGSGGKVFPDGVDAACLLSRWMDRLRANPSFAFYPGYRLVHIAAPRTLSFETEGKTVVVTPDAAILALGGASWPATGSDGSWREILASCGVAIAPFRPANCGFEADWPDALRERFAYVPLKNVRVSVAMIASVASGDAASARGELTLTPYGIEGGPLYALGAAIRDGIERAGFCEIGIDLAPDLSREAVVARFGGGPGKESLSNFFRKRLGLTPAAFALLRYGAERLNESPSCARGDSAQALRDPGTAASLVKALPLALYRPRPIEEAISTAGGVLFSELDDALMLRRLPGIFFAGEMLDWEAPTGGFLLQGCFSTGYRAALGVAAFSSRRGA